MWIVNTYLDNFYENTMSFEHGLIELTNYEIVQKGSKNRSKLTALKYYFLSIVADFPAKYDQFVFLLTTVIIDIKQTSNNIFIDSLK